MSHLNLSAHRLFTLCGVVAVLFGFLFLLQHSSGSLAGTVALLDSSKLVPAGGNAYAWSMPGKLRQGDSVASFKVTEDGQPLVQVQTSNQVRTEGKGRFSTSTKQVWISSTDGTDPRENGREYRIYIPRSVPQVLLVLAWLLVLFGFLLIVRGLSGLWAWAVWQKPIRSDALSLVPPREWSLDAIRGIAIILVLFAHVYLPTGLPDFIKPILAFLNRGGWTGVDLFFALSGYLISGLLLREFHQNGSVNIARFLYRRAWKIYPAHWMLIIATLFSATFADLPLAAISVDRVLQEFVYLQNYLGGVWGHTWSLAVEEHFYLLLAFAFAIGSSRVDGLNVGITLGWLPRLALAICIVCPILRTLRVTYGESFDLNYAATHLRADSLMWGVLLRYCREVRSESFVRWAGKLRWWGLLAAASLLYPCFAVDRNAGTMSVGLTGVSLAACLLILCLFGWQERRGAGLLFTPVCFLGRHSYTLYLWHFPLAQCFAPHYAWEKNVATSMLWFGAYVVTTLGVSVGTGWLIEEPLLRLRDRLAPSTLRTSIERG